jgi:peptide/nickel transport system permease protein
MTFRYFIKRFLGSIPLLFGITLISFIIMQLAPGDPTTMFTDPSVSMEDMAIVRQNLGLNRPIGLQYFYWLKEMCRGNLGYSYMTGKPVLLAIGERLPATLILSLSSLVLILLITFPLGLISGAKRNSKFDHFVTVFSFIGLSIPTFWLGLMLILMFSLHINWFPTSGFLDPALSTAGMWTKSLSILHHLCLPLGTILIGGIAGLTRYHRFSIISILSQDYITAGRARGLSENRLLYKHAFKNACLPIITLLGLSLPGLISGSFVIEYIFAWPGLGKMGVDAVFARDYPILMGTILFSSILIIAGNLVADLAYAWVDPRIEKRS